MDHPRLCGEKGESMHYIRAVYGITPAYAGKSVSYEKLPSVNKDHPRLCGEKSRNTGNVYPG